MQLLQYVNLINQFRESKTFKFEFQVLIGENRQQWNTFPIMSHIQMINKK